MNICMVSFRDPSSACRKMSYKIFEKSVLNQEVRLTSCERPWSNRSKCLLWLRTPKERKSNRRIVLEGGGDSLIGDYLMSKCDSVPLQHIQTRNNNLVLVRCFDTLQMSFEFLLLRMEMALALFVPSAPGDVFNRKDRGKVVKFANSAVIKIQFSHKETNKIVGTWTILDGYLIYRMKTLKMLSNNINSLTWIRIFYKIADQRCDTYQINTEKKSNANEIWNEANEIM